MNTPINQAERKQAITRFWGLYGALGLALFCILLGGILSSAFALSDKKETKLAEYEQAKESAEKLAARTDAIAPDFENLLRRQYNLHRSLQPQKEGLNITMNVYRDQLNGLATEAKKLHDSLRTHFQIIEKQALSSPLEKASLGLTNKLIAQIDSAFGGFYAVANGEMKSIPGTKAVGIRAIHEGVAEGAPADPVVAEKDEAIAALEDKVAMLEAEDKNEAVKKIGDEKDKAVKEAEAQRKLAEVYQHTYSAKGMLEVAERFINAAKTNRVNNRLQDAFDEIVTEYKTAIEGELDAAIGKLPQVDAAMIPILNSEIDNLKSRCRLLSLN